jgi:hypothetical protein
MLSLNGFFDAAGHASGDHALIVGGYMAAVPAWLKFEKEWNAALKKVGLSELHTTDFMACAPPYKTWRGREKEREALLMKLARITKKHVRYSLSTTVLLDDWREANALYQLKESHLTPYGLAGFFLVHRTMGWVAARQRRCRVALIFENGDQGKGDLIWLVDQVLRSLAARHNAILTFHPNKIAPLQAADFVMWEQRRLTKDRLMSSEEPVEFRKPLQELMTIKKRWGILDKTMIVKFCEDFDVPKRGVSAAPWTPAILERKARAAVRR